MQPRSNNKAGIPHFTDDEEAAEWYECHELTDHLDDTEEVAEDTIMYQDSKGSWYRLCDGIQVPPPIKGVRRGRSSLVRIIHEVVNRPAFEFHNERNPEDDEVMVEIAGDTGGTWTSSSLSSAITPK